MMKCLLIKSGQGQKHYIYMMSVPMSSTVAGTASKRFAVPCPAYKCYREKSEGGGHE